MGLSLTQRAQDAQPIEPRERLERLTGFTASQLAAGMTWLAGYDPRTFDAVLDAVEPGTGQDGDGSDDPEPFCATCGIPIGIFLRLGLDWRHYRQAVATADGQHDHGDATASGGFEVFDPGHEPVVTWRLTGDAAIRL
jgi:hypothetical protein